MKKHRFSLNVFVAISIIVTSFGFTDKKPDKPFIFNTLYYVNGICNQSIPFTTGQLDCRDNRLTASCFLTESNWQTTPNSATLGSGDYIGELIYNSYDYMSVYDALSDVWDYYYATGILPFDGAEIVTSNKHITIRRATSHY